MLLKSFLFMVLQMTISSNVFSEINMSFLHCFSILIRESHMFEQQRYWMCIHSILTEYTQKTITNGLSKTTLFHSVYNKSAFFFLFKDVHGFLQNFSKWNDLWIFIYFLFFLFIYCMYLKKCHFFSFVHFSNNFVT